MRIRTWFISGGMLAIIAIPLLMSVRSGPPPVLPTVTAETGTLVEQVQVTGKVVPCRTVEIKCKASGTVQRVGVVESSPVKKGEVLVELDPIDEQRLMRQAEIALAESQARLEQAKISLVIAKEDLASERSRAESALSAAATRNSEATDRAVRAKKLFDQGLVSAEELAREQAAAAELSDLLVSARQRIADLVTKERSLELKQQDLVLAETQVDSNTIRVSIAKQSLLDTRIIAPIDGIAVKVEVAEGQIISSGISTYGGGTTVMTLADQRLEVVAQVDESDIRKINLGQETEIRTNAFPGKKWRGSVTRIAAKGESQNSAILFEIRIALDDATSTNLRPEMTTTVVITTASAQDAILIPVDAVTWRKDKAYVTTQAEGKEVEITTGANNGEKIQVLSGIAAGTVLNLPAKGTSSRWRPDTVFSQ